MIGKNFWFFVIFFVGYVDFVLCRICGTMYFDKKQINKNTCIFIHIFFAVIIGWCSYIVKNDIMRFIVLIVICFIWIRIRYVGNIKQHSMLIIVWVAFTCFCGYIIYQIYMPILPKSSVAQCRYNGTFVLMSFCAKLFIFMLTRIWDRIIRLRYMPYRTSELFVYLGPVVTILTMYIMARAGESIFINPRNTIFVILISILLILSDLNTWRNFEDVLEDHKQKIHFKYLQEKMQKQYTRYREIEKNKFHNDKVIHDVKNHIRCLEQLIEQQHMKDATYYIDELKKSILPAQKIFNTNNLILDVVLNDYFDTARQYGIEVKGNVNGEYISFMSDMDICAVYGNLMDNALEACIKMKDIDKLQTPTISITTKQLKGVKIIKLENTYNGTIRKCEGTLISTKENPDLHGLGLSNVRSIVEKYGGDMYIEYDKSFFTVKIIF